MKWIYATILSLMELTMVGCLFFVVIVTYQEINTDINSSIQIEIENSQSSDLAASGVLQLTSEGEKVFEEVKLATDNYQATLFFKKPWSIPYFLYLIKVFFYGFLLFQFYQLIKVSGKGEAFEWRNIRRVNYIGIAFIVWWFADMIMARVKDFILDRYLVAETISFTKASIDLIPNFFESKILIGLMFLILAFVFKQGFNLKEDRDLTI